MLKPFFPLNCRVPTVVLGEYDESALPRLLAGLVIVPPQMAQPRTMTDRGVAVRGCFLVTPTLSCAPRLPVVQY